jgi:hypothetical protein
MTIKHAYGVYVQEVGLYAARLKELGPFNATSERCLIRVKKAWIRYANMVADDATGKG